MRAAQQEAFDRRVILPADASVQQIASLIGNLNTGDAVAEAMGIREIAGYDAYPIDGVQGAKTQAAIAKFLNERKAKTRDLSTLISWGFRLVEYHKKPEYQATLQASPK